MADKMFDRISPEEIKDIFTSEDRWLHDDSPQERIADAQKNFTLKQVIEWGNKDCLHRTMANLDGEGDVSLYKRSDCCYCWAELQKGVEGG